MLSTGAGCIPGSCGSEQSRCSGHEGNDDRRSPGLADVVMRLRYNCIDALLRVCGRKARMGSRKPDQVGSIIAQYAVISATSQKYASRLRSGISQILILGASLG